MHHHTRLAYVLPLTVLLAACKAKAPAADTTAVSATATPTPAPTPTATPDPNAMGHCHVTGRLPKTETEDISKANCDSKGGTFTEHKPAPKQ